MGPRIMSQPASVQNATPVTINGELLPAWLLAREFNQLVNRLVSSGQPPNTDAARQQVLNDAMQNAVEILLLLQEADRTIAPLAKGLHRKRRDVWLKEHGGRDAAFKAFQVSPARPDALEAIISREIRYAELVGVVARAVPVPSEADCRAYFDGNPDQFHVPEKAVFQQIFRDNHGDPAAETTLMLRIQQAWQAGQPGEQLSRQFSRPTPAEPGRLFDFTRGRASPEWAELESTLFSLQPGKVSDVIRTGYGYHLVRLERVEPARDIPFEQAHASIGAHLHRERVEQQLGEKVDALRAAAVITGLPAESA